MNFIFPPLLCRGEMDVFVELGFQPFDLSLAPQLDRKENSGSARSKTWRVQSGGNYLAVESA